MLNWLMKFPKNIMMDIFKSSVLAGICIALGGAVFLKVGGIIAHSIADAFYFLSNPFSSLASIDVLIVYLSEIVGNFIE